MICFWTDTVILYTELIKEGYQADNIFVLFGRGYDFELDILPVQYDPEPNITDYPARVEDVENIFAWLRDGNSEENIPALTDSDFLFVWTFGHGGFDDLDNDEVWDPGEEIFLCLMDENFQSGEGVYEPMMANVFSFQLNQITFHKRVIWMQQCLSGGFIEFLERDENEDIIENNIIMTACDISEFARVADNSDVEGDYTNEDSYENECIDYDIYKHGEFNFYCMASLVGQYPIGTILYGLEIADSDINDDSIVSCYETKVFNEENNSVYLRSHLETPQYSDVSNIGETTSLEYPSFITQDITVNQSYGGIVAILDDISVDFGAVLSFEDNARVLLLDHTQLIVQAGASINIGNNVVFIGETKTILKDLPFIPETIPGNRIEIYGGITIGSGVEFTVEDDEYWDGLYLLGNDDVIITDGLFNHCDLENKLGNIEISVTDFSYSHLINNSATLEIEDCDFDGCDSGTGIYCYDNSEISISNSDIHDYNTGVKLYSCSNYEISDCAVYENLSHGIFINDSYTGTNLISYSNIYNNSGDGIRFYTSKSTIESCYINNNSRGLFCYHTSVIELLKDPNTEPWTDGSIITDNDLEEILLVDDCVILMDQNRNMIIDNNISGGYDQYLARCPDMNYNQVWRYNYWGYDGPFGATLPPENRFYPACINPDANETGYVLSSVWDPGIPGGDGERLVEALYNDAGEALAEEDSVLADQLFKEVITQYPETEYAIASAKRLLEANSDYEELQDYYITEPNLHYNADIDNYANYLSNYCNIKLEDYEEAILNFEEVITNPPSEIDSVMAIIDIGFTYLVMEENGDRASFVGNIVELKPESREEFEQNQEDLLACLLENPAVYQDNIPSEDMIPESALLYSNFPNPFNPETTISFSLPEASDVELSIYNIKGQKVRTLLAEEREMGKHSVVWSGDDDTGKKVSSGVYFYQIAVNGEIERMNKCLLLK